MRIDPSTGLLTLRLFVGICHQRLIVGSLGVLFGFAMAAPAFAQYSLEFYVEKLQIISDDKGAEKIHYVEAQTVLPGDELRYSISLTNVTQEVKRAGKIIITNPLPANTRYVVGSAAGMDAEITYSTDRGETFSAEAPPLDATVTTIRWSFVPSQHLDKHDRVWFNVTMKSTTSDLPQN